jgi:hypothetical protein
MKTPLILSSCIVLFLLMTTSANAWTGNRTRAYRDCTTGDAGMTLWSAKKMRRVADCLDGWARLNRDLARELRRHADGKPWRVDPIPYDDR